MSDRNQTRGRDLLWILEQALEGGARAIQLREKDLGGRELFSLAEKFKELCVRYGALLFINDRVDVALGIDADGIQIGNASMPLKSARKLLGNKKMIGVSIHSVAEAQEAEKTGADFVLFGPVYFTPSKAAFGDPQGIVRLKEVVEKISLPVYAIGGVKGENVAELKETGCHGIAVISAVVSASKPKAAVQRLIRALRGTP